MLLTAGIWLLKAGGAIKAFLAGLIKLISEHPLAFLAGAVLVLTNYGTYRYTQNATETRIYAEVKPTMDKLKGEIEVANAEVTARNEKIERLEKESKKDAEDAASLINAKKAEITRIGGLYKSTLAKNVRLKAYTVTLPAKDGAPETVVKVQTEDGNIVCNRFPSTFLDTINKMVDVVNTVIVPTTGEVK